MAEVWLGFAVCIGVLLLIAIAVAACEHGYQWRTTGRWMR